MEGISIDSTPLTPLSTATKSGHRGRRRLVFESLSKSTKNKQSQKLARENPLEKLLQSSEKVARKLKNPHTAKMLKLLRTGGEIWAKNALNSIERAEKNLKPTAESSLMLKTRLGLSKSKYQGKGVCM